MADEVAAVGSEKLRRPGQLPFLRATKSGRPERGDKIKAEQWLRPSMIGAASNRNPLWEEVSRLEGGCGRVSAGSSWNVEAQAPHDVGQSPQEGFAASIQSQL